jgi:hypothetical protein
MLSIPKSLEEQKYSNVTWEPEVSAYEFAGPNSRRYSHCGVPVRTRAALGTCGQVACVRTVLLTVCPVVTACVRTQSGPVQTIGLHTRLDSKRVLSGPLIRPDAPH